MPSVVRHVERTPLQLARRLLARFGDRRFVRRVEFGRAPRSGLFAGVGPADGVWASLVVPHTLGGDVVSWEAYLVGEAPPGTDLAEVSDNYQPFGQQFPPIEETAFKRRLRALGRRYGFHVAALRFLRPLQVAPLVVIRTDRSRTSFAPDFEAIYQLLDPPARYEGFFLEARDRGGSFLDRENTQRGAASDGGAAWNGCWYPGTTFSPPANCPPGSPQG